MTDKIGEFLMSIGALTEAQVAEVLRVQEDGDEPRLFGEVAIELGYIDDVALKRWVESRNPS